MRTISISLTDRIGAPLARVTGTSLLALVCLVGWVSCETARASMDQASATRLIDQRVREVWSREKITPSPKSDDAEFFRRLYLDVCGVAPPANEALQFIQDRNPQKRQQAIERLMNSPLAAENWAREMGVLLVGRQPKARVVPREAFEAWLKNAYGDNVPYDKFVREVLTAQGMSDQNPAASVIAKLNGADKNGKPEEIAGATARLFMGTRIQCAQCHNHKTEKWTQKDFWGMAAYFAQVRVRPVMDREAMRLLKVSKENKSELSQQEMRELKNRLQPRVEVLDMPRGDLRLPKTDEVVPPRFLNGLQLSDITGMSRRQEFAALMTSTQNRLFAQEAVNRLWDRFLGRGFVRPVDDLRESNPPSHPELLQQLSDDFVSSGYDLKRMMRIMLNSETYQLSSRPSSFTDPDDPFFSRARLRPLTPEQLFYSLLSVTGIESFLRERQGERVDDIEYAFLRRFISYFDTGEMQEVEDFQGTIPQALFLLNGDLVNRGVGSFFAGNLSKILNAPGDDAAKIQQVYLTVLGRLPLPKETNDLLQFVNSNATSATQYPAAGFGRTNQQYASAQGAAPGGMWRQRLLRGRGQSGATNPKAMAYEDVFWAMLNSSQFVFNH